MDDTDEKQAEWRAFILLVIFLGPIVSVIVVGGYGFMVWISQILLGPPGV